MKVKYLKPLGFKSRAVLSKTGGDIFICNDKAFKRILQGKYPGKNFNSLEKPNDYFHYGRTHIHDSNVLMHVYYLSNLDVFLMEDEKFKRKEVIIKTTDTNLFRQITKEYSEEDLLELEKDELIDVEREKKTNNIISIKTSKKANILNVLKKMDFDEYQYTGFLALAKIKPDWDKDTFNREQIELYIKKRLETKTYNQFYEVDENNLPEVLKSTNYPNSDFNLKVNLTRDRNIHIVCLKEGKDFSKRANYKCISLKSDKNTCEVLSYSNDQFNLFHDGERDGEAYIVDLEKNYERAKTPKLKDEFIEKITEESESQAHFVREQLGKTNINFLSIKF